MNKSNFVVVLVATAIFSLAITQYANAQEYGVIPDNGPMCPEGHDCHCIITSGVYVDKTGIPALIWIVWVELEYIIRT